VSEDFCFFRVGGLLLGLKAGRVCSPCSRSRTSIWRMAGISGLSMCATRI